ncbi:MAG TPA: aminoacyl-tRNA hydrolase [Acidobacteriaceae bacterium]
MFLVVGLGNPGIEYQFTPHNAGFLAIDRIASRHGATVANRRGRAQTARVLLGSREVVLAKPETFMNVSGVSVAALVGQLGVNPASDLVVVYDELALPLGSIRVRPGGSSGGHNGARSIIGALGMETWPRVRIGVGPEIGQQHGRRGSSYLLAPMRRMELQVLDGALDQAADAVEAIVAEGVPAAMNRFNRRERNGPAE